MSIKRWWAEHVVAPNPDQAELSVLDLRDGVTVPAADGVTPAFHLVVRDGSAFVFDPAVGPLDGRSSLERFPVMPKAPQPVIPDVTR